MTVSVVSVFTSVRINGWWGKIKTCKRTSSRENKKKKKKTRFVWSPLWAIVWLRRTRQVIDTRKRRVAFRAYRLPHVWHTPLELTRSRADGALEADIPDTLMIPSRVLRPAAVNAHAPTTLIVAGISRYYATTGVLRRSRPALRGATEETSSRRGQRVTLSSRFL